MYSWQELYLKAERSYNLSRNKVDVLLYGLTMKHTYLITFSVLCFLAACLKDIFVLVQIVLSVSLNIMKFFKRDHNWYHLLLTLRSQIYFFFSWI